MLVKELFAKALERLEEKNILVPRYSLERLLGNMLECMPKDVYLHFDKKIDREKFNNLLEQRLLGKPIEYILQTAYFCGLEFFINGDVLIPRQETEILVELISKKLSNKDLKGKILLDLCTGSGCIGISLKKRFPNLEVILSDICPKALEVAKKNATKNNVEVSAICGDFLEPFSGLKADFIVSNPPYISLDEYPQLSKEVKDFEPQKALTAGNNGLYFYEQFKNKAPSFLNPKAKVFFEIGYLQKNSLQKIYSETSFFIKKEFLKDLSGKDRFFFLEIE
jgi:release factor glutamine methyltransferase